MKREGTKSAERMTRDELADVLRGADFRGLGVDFGDACERLADAVRALPVIAACGQCGWSRGSTTYDGPTLFCAQSVPERPLHRGNEPEPPPAWCPLRGGAR